MGVLAEGSFRLTKNNHSVKFALAAVDKTVLVPSGGRDPVAAHLRRDSSVQPTPPCDAGGLFKLLLPLAAVPGPHVFG